ncbi:hypothetical protein CANINC_004352 [Pichia inconspicua]|uniref:Polynucleotide 5'-hydroxyl-kinase GRC3 n=1 Tax=Pichia inconspicua TaxID=52247 RepID=A0A4T0WY08_9ASCO|nr:hypothetical protein CANINC_004352 [[Candida] inconspicua]
MDFGLDRITVEIPAFSEWRVETSKSSTMTLQLESGTAEIFGTELSPNISYVFNDSMKFAVATYQGCKISYTTTHSVDSEYISDETILKQILNLHYAIENLAKNKRSRILIVGPKDCGKTSMARTLTSYALKTSEKQPFLINLNPKLPHFSISSQLTAVKVHDSLDAESTTLGETFTTGPGTGIYRSQIPLVKNFGLENFDENLELYRCLISELAEVVESKISASSTDSGTVIVDTPPLNVSNWKLIQHIVDSFHINLILVVGNERLLVDLRKKLTLPEDLSMIKMPRSSGCIEKEPKYERDLQQRAIRQYFYGVERSQLNPYTLHCSIKDFVFLKPLQVDSTVTDFLDFISGDAEDDDSIRPKVEDEDDYDPLKGNSSKVVSKPNFKYDSMFERVSDPKEMDLANVILSIIDDTSIDLVKLMTNTKSSDQEKLIELTKQVVSKSVLGFAYVAGCDDATGKLKLLIPSPVSSMPGKILIITQMRYHE